MAMARLDQRVNIRIDTETYEAYEKVASFFNRSVAEVMRESLQAGVEVMNALGAIIDRAKAGDGESVQKLFDALWQMQRGQLDLAQLQTATVGEDLAAAKQGAERTAASAGASNTAL
jgi:predicted DNA-binding protein